MRLPLVAKKKSVAPDGNKCPWCGETKHLKANSFAVLSGGALQPDASGKFTIEDPNLRGWLNLEWQGNQLADGTDKGVGVAVAHEVAGGQFHLNFCGTECLRAFLNYCVDELEQKIRR